jgi:hypothetical protein
MSVRNIPRGATYYVVFRLRTLPAHILCKIYTVVTYTVGSYVIMLVRNIPRGATYYVVFRLAHAVDPYSVKNIYSSLTCEENSCYKRTL